VIEDLPDGTLWEHLTMLYESVDNPDQYRDLLAGVNGIGPKTATNIRYFVEQGEVSEQYTGQPSEPKTVGVSSSDTEHTRGTSLDDFGE
jgi:hypothetical protein